MKGLSSEEAEKLLSKHGKNELVRKKKTSVLKILFSQFTSPLTFVLIFAALISLGVGFLPGEEPKIVDTLLILAIVVISGLSGFFQDYKAEKTIESLQQISTPSVRVIRDGKEITLSRTDLVPGDVVIIEEGNIVPADCKIIELFNLEVDESVLTGESISIKKKLNEQVFQGSFIISGNATALVEKTGMDTKMGQIATQLQEITEEKTEFQKEIAAFSKKILYIILFIIVAIFILGFFKYGLYGSLLTSVSLAVAAIPEGLPAVLVLVLAMGAKVMATKNALVRKLNVVESLGAVDIICTDKTGTLTKNEMTVTKAFFNDKEFNLESSSDKQLEDLKQLIMVGALCNNSKVSFDENKKKVYLGDQTEIALKKVSERFENLGEGYEKIGEVAFDSKRKMMSSFYKKGSKFYVFSKGAPEILLNKCNKIYRNGRTITLTRAMKNMILEQNNDFASQALRVLGFAYKEAPKDKCNEEDLVWVGLQAMMDPPRKEVKQALKECGSAGIRVIMMTGDNPLTAKAIAEQINLKSNGVLTGVDVEKLSDKELSEKLKEVSIFARVSPFHKLRLLTLLKEEYRVAMTGDGVNDALALKKADIGISVGTGTDVAKEASDVILLDDNFASIVSAVKEGRRSFDNIRKFINYLFVSNLAEVGVLFLATLFFTLKQPILLPIQILWINLLTDGLPALALGVDPARPRIMQEPPRKKGEKIINKKLSWLIGVIGIKKIIMLLLTFWIVYNMFGVGQARAALFTGFILYEFVRIGTIRSQEKLNWFSNKWLLAALFGSLLLQLVVIYTPISTYFAIEPLNLVSWGILVTGVVISYMIAIGLTKIVIKYIKD